MWLGPLGRRNRTYVYKIHPLILFQISHFLCNLYEFSKLIKFSIVCWTSCSSSNWSMFRHKVMKLQIQKWVKCNVQISPIFSLWVAYMGTLSLSWKHTMRNIPTVYRCVSKQLFTSVNWNFLNYITTLFSMS